MTLDLQRRLKQGDSEAIDRLSLGSNDIRSPKEIETLMSLEPQTARSAWKTSKFQ